MKPSVARYAAALGIFFLSFTVTSAAESAEPRAEIEHLRREIARHDALYHRQAAPEISDADYDRLKRRLRELEQTHPIAAQTAAAVRDETDERSGVLPTARHVEPMLSLEKAYTAADVRAFHARVAKALGRPEVACVVEPKFDGLAVSLVYEHGRLVRAVTRGNGRDGDDITAHVRPLPDVPAELDSAAPPPARLEVRGELHVAWSDFARVNAERDLAGEARFATPRSLAAGTVRLLDSAEAARRGLRVAVFGLGACAPVAARPGSQTALLVQLRAWGFPNVPDARTAIGAAAIGRALEALGAARAALGFPIDGAVVKVDAVADQTELGRSETAPRWAVAYKFEPERAETVVRAITVQVGRTGVLTPVAELVPVALAGTTVARATLHNREEIARRDVRLGDTVWIEKAGDIIPAVVGVNLARRPADAVPYVFPSACPDCRAPVVGRAGEVAVRCGNGACPAQLRRRLEHFASKACLDLDGLGPALVETLVASGRVRDLPDLDRLTRADLRALGRGGEKGADRLFAALEGSKRAELWRVVHGLGVPQVGAAAAKELARRYRSLEALLAASRSVDAGETGGAPGPDPADRALRAFLAEPRGRATVEGLLAAGFAPVAPAATGRQLAGKTLVLTGALPVLTRAQATALIEAAGGKVAAAVNRNSHYVVAGEGAGAKLEQARRLGVPVIDETELRRLAEAP
jgi:DNA ligase (NAD+)